MEKLSAFIHLMTLSCSSLLEKIQKIHIYKTMTTDLPVQFQVYYLLLRAVGIRINAPNDIGGTIQTFKPLLPESENLYTR